MSYWEKVFHVLVLSTAIGFYSSLAFAGGPWSEQYCTLTTETVRTIVNGEVVDEETKEVQNCHDGAMDFLAYSGIAKDCKEFWYDIRLSGQMVQQRGFICQKFDGSWEIVNPGDHNY